MMCHIDKDYLLISTMSYSDKSVGLIRKFKGLYIYEVFNNECGILHKNNIIRYLDSFYLELPNNTSEQKRFWDDLYGFIDGSYECYIDKNNNLACISLLIHNLNNYHLISKESTLLDFGCGSGLSLETEWNNKCRIIGYERNYSMYKMAITRGMNVFLPETIDSCLNNSIDAVFSSFVFHMSVDYEDLLKISPKLKKNAPWSLNFYKDINKEKAIRMFRDFGYKYESFGAIKKFGSVCVFYK